MNTFPGHAALHRDALALAAMARESAATGGERRVLHLKLSALPAHLNRLQHQRLLREALVPLLRPTRARLFDLPTGDMVAVSPPPGDYVELVRATLHKLVGEEGAGCFQELRLPQQAAALLSLVEGALGLADSRPPVPMRAWMQAPAANPRAGEPPGADDILAAEAALGRADLSVHHRWRSICEVVDGQPGARLLWRELRLAEADIQAALLPGQSLAQTPWLRRRLRARIDQRALAQWATPQELRDFSPRGLGLLPASVASEAFLRLDAMLPPACRAQLTLGFTLRDILADPAGFAVARRLARLRGYRLALDSLDAAELCWLPVGLWEFDVLQLRFGPALLELDAAGRAALEAALPQQRDRVVLTGADEPIAIGWGWQRGISRFQGRVVEAR